MRKTTTENGGLSVDLLAIRELNIEIARRAVECGHRRSGVDLHIAVARHAIDHAADCIFSPLPGRHQLGVARQDRCAAERIFLFNQYTGTAYRTQAVCCGQTGRSAAYDQNWFGHTYCPICLNPGPDVIIFLGSYKDSPLPASTSFR